MYTGILTPYPYYVVSTKPVGRALKDRPSHRSQPLVRVVSTKPVGRALKEGICALRGPLRHRRIYQARREGTESWYGG